MQFFCNSAGTPEEDLVILSVDETNACNPVIKLSHKTACPVFSLGTYTGFLINRPWILSPLLIIFGLAVTLVGRKFFSWTIGFLGIVLGFVVTTLLFQMLDILDYQSGVKETNYFVFTV